MGVIAADLTCILTNPFYTEIYLQGGFRFYYIFPFSAFIKDVFGWVNVSSTREVYKGNDVSRKLTGMPTVFQSGPDDYNDQAVYQDTKMILSNT